MKFLFIAIISLNTISSSAQTTNSDSKQWLLELTTNDIGTVRTVMTFEFQDSTFNAYTRKNADRMILGFWTSSLGRLFTNDFKNGSLLHIVKGKRSIHNDSIVLFGIFASAIGNYYFNGTIVDGKIRAFLTNKNNEIRGTINGSSNVPELPLENYSAIFNQAVDITAHKIFDPQILDHRKWKKFNKKMEKVSSKVMDDLEMIFAFFYYGGQLPFSHFALMKIPKPELSSSSSEYEPQIILEEKSYKTAYMKILSFSGTVSEVDSIMSIVKRKDYQNLIVDLRDNSGGSVAAGLALTNSIIDTSFIGGVFLTQKWFNEHEEIPNTEEYDQFPLFSKANFDLLIEGIHNEVGLCLQVIPSENAYSGNVFILTNNKTASTCEPIVYGLKQFKQATIVGEKTAGAMLNGEFFDLQSGFSLVVPTATYYTADGYKIDKNGVKPNIETDEALDFVMHNLIKE